MKRKAAATMKKEKHNEKVAEKEENGEFDEPPPPKQQKDIFGRVIQAPGTWQIEKDYWIFTHKDAKPSVKIASFDMDGTLITTKSGNVFPKDTSDWKLLFDCIPKKIKELHTQGYKIVIFTNQKGLQVGKVDKPGFKRKIEAIVGRIGSPIQVFVAISDGKYRKPCVGMWEELVDRNGEVEIVKKDSLFVGDAAGRTQTTKRPKKDHSSADRNFALNIGVKFYTPEEFFLSDSTSEPFEAASFNPKAHLEKAKDLLTPKDAILPSKSPEIIVMVGFPGSGKSKFAQKLAAEHKYQIVNRDTLGTWQKCKNATYQHVSNGQSVVVDNTNPDKESRARYVSVAKELNVPCRCFQMNCDYAQARHHVAFRTLTNPRQNEVSSMVLKMHQGKFQKPTLEEGFSEIVTVNFVPDFENEDHKKIYEMYLTES